MTVSEMLMRNCRVSSVLCALMQAVVCLPLATRLIAQDPGQPVPAGAQAAAPGADPIEREIVALASAKQFHLLRQYAIEINRLDTAVALDDSQKSQLNIGAKEIAKNAALQVARELDQMDGAGVMPVGGGAPLPSKPRAPRAPVNLVEIKSYAEVGWETKIGLEGGFIEQRDHREDPAWKQLVKSVLKPEQYVKFENSITVQKQSVQKTMIEEGIAKLEVELLLSPDQASRLSALVTEQLAKDSAVSAQNPPPVAGMPGGLRTPSFLRGLAKVDAKKIREVLDPLQFELLDLQLLVQRRLASDMAPAMMIVP